MAAATAGNPVRGDSRATPAITVTPLGVVLGAGFLPDHEVTVRITPCGESVSDYLTYTSDCDGHLYADLSPTRTTGQLQITATDHRPDPDGRCGRTWSNTYTLKVVAN